MGIKYESIQNIKSIQSMTKDIKVIKIEKEFIYDMKVLLCYFDA